MFYWILCILGVPLLCALSDIERKKALAGKSNAVVTAICYNYLAAGTCVWLAVDTYQRGFPKIGPDFWLALLLATPFNAANRITWFAALKSTTPASLVTPMSSVVPVACLLTGLVVLGEIPNAFGAAGILVIVAGAYLLKVEEAGHLFGPFKALWNEPGSRLALISSLFTSVATVFEKQGAMNSSPALFLCAQSVLTAIGFNAYSWSRRSPEYGQEMRAFFSTYWRAGLTWSGANVITLVCLTHILTSYVQAIRVLSVPIVVILGGVYLQEKNMKQRLVASLFMCAGMALIVLTK